ncbi:MAG: hypothetical protein MUE82_08140 [Chloroflexi bacterium]|jgi:hypothetical protein|nr:hypothetical protein [Chloroflexota bacterium]
MTAAVSIPPRRGYRRPALPSVRLLAWGGWLALAASVVASVAVWASDGFPSLPLSFASGPANVVAVSLVSLSAGTVGALLAWRHPRSAIGWLLLVQGLLLGLLTPVNLLVGQGLEAARMWPATTVAAAWAMSTFLTPVTAGTGILVLLLFPDGRFAGRRWWTAGVVTFVGTGLLAGASALGPSGMLWYPAVPNPTSLPYALDVPVGGMRIVGVGLTVLALGLAGASVLVRYRHADRRLRLQLRWIVAGVVVMGVAFMPFLLGRYVIAVGDGVSDALLVFAAAGAAAFPLTVAVAIVREHLYEIDAIIWRTLVYIPLMGLLAGLYAASVALFQRLFVSMTGNGTDAAIVLSSLILAGAFTPARQAIEARVSKRFKPAEPQHRTGDGEPMPAQAAPPDIFAGREQPAADAAPRADRIAALEDRIAALEATLAAREVAGA